MKEKPVVFVQGSRSGFYSQNTFAQNLLLKALSKGVTDPQELKKIAGLKRVADVYRTLDKMAIRKEYHESLAAAGISLDYIVSELNIFEKHKDSIIGYKGIQNYRKVITSINYIKEYNKL